MGRYADHIGAHYCGESRRRELPRSRALPHCEVPTLVLVGFQVKACMKVACQEVLTDNQLRDTPFHVPVGLWHGNDGGFLDPYEAIVPSEHRKVLTMEEVFRAYNLDFGASVDSVARAARLLATNAQLLGYSRWEE